MKRENKELEIMNTITSKDKKILSRALDGIKGWSFNPVAVVTNGIEDYYFICKVKTIVENLQMKMARIYIKIQENNEPRLLSIEEIV
ncbi:hypothetical protein [Clostridium saccharobutylicum]|uniref:Uncharacterized protein n=1 Tax=Clostridium saccharobutylicum DSM 13864 TaxID=1345695 RepID=U5MU20_CLOSA|nr:hypothetical protein [Clostridium saccharobutylicum]AGX44294.1 hypothetical protein CLSA_c33310 [Clostridium saccharobutylicum DSM 13864]AQR91585.1 hypothetical protein CLOSC_33110 [Clostridium saccharobutylicum]AQS01490.1 hypothetical protein CSACC_33190 [Clostridium saccharobutylicum]AQS15473.1 hypothetical protein CLOSACC_33190 [Clostridium saccharobutylicum]MBA2906996.1 hypothetical protein [Clostridium saccharobutylicum]